MRQNVSKHHKRYWQDIGELFVALVQANASDMTRPVLHKKGPSGKFNKKELNLADAVSKEGLKVGSKAEKGMVPGRPPLDWQSALCGRR